MATDRIGRLKTAAIAVFLVVWLCLFCYRFVSPEARAGRSFLEHMPVEDIRYVRLEPTGADSLISKPIVVRDKVGIQALLAPMKGLSHMMPNHPQTSWKVAITIGTDHAQYGGVITGTKNQGVLFTYYSGVTAGWVFQEYVMKDPSGVIRSMADSQPGD
jgi:hypothetical protein